MSNRRRNCKRIQQTYSELNDRFQRTQYQWHKPMRISKPFAIRYELYWEMDPPEHARAHLTWRMRNYVIVAIQLTGEQHDQRTRFGPRKTNTHQQRPTIPTWSSTKLGLLISSPVLSLHPFFGLGPRVYLVGQYIIKKVNSQRNIATLRISGLHPIKVRKASESHHQILPNWQNLSAFFDWTRCTYFTWL